MLGPGKPGRVNTVLGRALRLIMMNVGHAYPGSGDMDTIGTPHKYSFCMAENEDASPWTAFHEERGFRKDQSTVTVLGGCGRHAREGLQRQGGRAAEYMGLCGGAPRRVSSRGEV